ncbi:MAG: DNA replication regulator sld2 [Icmadophila ericetorum]|nr:DNA replication regulator sld2 [Icmadophila ericetorum]
MSITSTTLAESKPSKPLKSLTVESLRALLKKWEKAFANANEGRKASREDIKKNPDIAEKYKLYDKLRAHFFGKSKVYPSETSSSPRPAKRRKITSSEEVRPSSSASAQPLVSRFQLQPEALSSKHPAILDPYDSPHAIRTTLTPTAFRTSIGPTPQRDGIVLGLFDLLSPESASKVTASLQKQVSDLSATPTKPRDVCATPSKRRLDVFDTEISRRHSRTPQSISKRNYLATFMTPSTRRITEQKTPSSRTGVRKLNFEDTPAFLRRDSQHLMFTAPKTKKGAGGDENDEDREPSWSPVAMRMPPKPAGRTLSQLMKGLRDIQEDAIEDELDILRELENEQSGGSRPMLAMPKIQPPKLLVRDSQIEMPLGPDAGSEDGSDDESLEKEGKGRSGRLLKIYKKKGQKRSTRRVNIKPTAAKWKPEPEWKGGGENEEEVEAVAETQIRTNDVLEGCGIDDLAEDADADAKFLEIGEHALRAHLRKEKEDLAEADGGENAAMVGKPKKAKKVNALAHTNFRALNIKNKNSKAKGKGSRFARRR